MTAAELTYRLLSDERRELAELAATVLGAAADDPLGETKLGEQPDSLVLPDDVVESMGIQVGQVVAALLC